MSLESTIKKLVDSKIEKAMQGGPQTVLAEYKGTDSQGKGWVVIAGSTETTPITRATVEAAPGDTVSVTIGDGKCVMDANISNPSAGVAGVRKAEMTANQAKDDAEKAIAFSQQASTAASSAQASAQSAANAAGDAQATANAVHGMAEQAQRDASTAKTAAEAATGVLEGMQEAAEAAGTTLEGIYQDAADAQTAAESAQSSASAATRSLSDVERVVGTLNWIAEHGEYVPTQDAVVAEGKTYYTASHSYHLTEDTEVDSSKTYYTRSGSGTEADPYVYTVVASPDVSEIATYYERSTAYSVVPEPVTADIATYYELSLDESVQSFIASHVWLDDYGLNLSVDSANGYRIHQGTVDGTEPVGTYIVNPYGEVEASFTGEGVFVGSLDASHISIGPSSLDLGYGDLTPWQVTVEESEQTVGTLTDTVTVRIKDKDESYEVIGYTTQWIMVDMVPTQIQVPVYGTVYSDRQFPVYKRLWRNQGGTLNLSQYSRSYLTSVGNASSMSVSQMSEDSTMTTQGLGQAGTPVTIVTDSEHPVSTSLPSYLSVVKDSEGVWWLCIDDDANFKAAVSAAGGQDGDTYEFTVDISVSCREVVPDDALAIRVGGRATIPTYYYSSAASLPADGAAPAIPCLCVDASTGSEYLYY